MLKLFAPFRGQSKLAHFGLVIAGVGAFLLGTYGTAFYLYDGMATFVAPGSEAVVARRASFMVGAVCCWLVFAVGFLLTVGGPVLNFAWYPLTILTAATSVAYPLLFGPRPEAVFTEAFVIYSPEGIRDVVVLIVPGAVVFVLVVLSVAMLTIDSEEETRAWMERHLPASFLEAFSGEFEDGEWIDE